jgi:four helix bundle protein
MNNFDINPYRELEERAFRFAKNCRDFVMKIPKNIPNIEYSKQLIRSSGSQAANYIEANEGVSKKDLNFRTKICRKETKESALWLNLIIVEAPELLNERDSLLRESEELRKIYSKIVTKTA